MTVEAGIDLVRLASWMDDQGLPCGPIEQVEALTGGTQNVLLRFWRGGACYVLRHPPVHKRAESDEVMRREARVLAALADTDVPHPRLVAACGDTTVLGAAFYLMHSVEGANPKVGLPAPYLANPTWRRELGLAVAEAAAAVGGVDYIRAGLADFGRPDGFLERQVARWRSQLRSYAALPGYDGPAGDLGDIDAIGAWLDDNRPTSWSPGLMHGDFHLANVLCSIDRPGVAAIVDWELATIGNPLLDLGWLLATWPEADDDGDGPVVVEPWEGFPGRVELVARYAERSGRDVARVDWYEVLACYKLAIILEGTYARSRAGTAPRETGETLHSAAVILLCRARRRIAASAG